MAEESERSAGAASLRASATPFVFAPSAAVPSHAPDASRAHSGERGGPGARGGRGGRGGRGSRDRSGDPRAGGRDPPRAGGRHSDSPRAGGQDRGDGGSSSSSSTRRRGTPAADPPRASRDAAPTHGGGKGVRADFLLNFHAPARPSGSGGRAGSGRGGRSGGGAGSGGRASSSSGAAPSRRLARRGIYRKELFLQANFRFLVADFANLDGAANDPDHVVDWDDVVLVEMASEAPLTCPVCLDAPPEAPQVTLCGHAFCFRASPGTRRRTAGATRASRRSVRCASPRPGSRI